jgi:hypothetical protein
MKKGIATTTAEMQAQMSSGVPDTLSDAMVKATLDHHEDLSADPTAVMGSVVGRKLTEDVGKQALQTAVEKTMEGLVRLIAPEKARTASGEVSDSRDRHILDREIQNYARRSCCGYWGQ